MIECKMQRFAVSGIVMSLSLLPTAMGRTQKSAHGYTYCTCVVHVYLLACIEDMVWWLSS